MCFFYFAIARGRALCIGERGWWWCFQWRHVSHTRSLVGSLSTSTAASPKHKRDDGPPATRNRTEWKSCANEEEHARPAHLDCVATRDTDRTERKKRMPITNWWNNYSVRRVWGGGGGGMLGCYVCISVGRRMVHNV